MMIYNCCTGGLEYATVSKLERTDKKTAVEYDDTS